MQASLKRKKEMVQILREIEFVVKFELTAGKKLYKNFDTFFGFKEKERWGPNVKNINVEK